MKGHILLSIALLIGGVLMLRGVWGAAKVDNAFSLKQIVVSSVTKGLETDEKGHTNILLIGHGGIGHDGEYLTDTMIVASIDHKKDLVPMLSIPRDLFVDSEAVGWGTRINGIYEHVYEKSGDHTMAIAALQQEIEKITGIEIHYFAQIDFSGFEAIVDAIGGIDVEVPQTIYDSTYPAKDGSGYTYDPFYIEAGPQHLDGETALKLARSRHSTSDFDRAKRQQMILNSIKNKATSLGVLLNPIKIKNVLSAVSENFKTDLSSTEMLNLAGMANEFSRDSILSTVLNDTPYEMGGFLYTPPREEYGGAFVLVPYVKDFSEIHRFANLFFYHPDIYKNPIGLELVNGTKANGLASLAMTVLSRYGLKVDAFGNGASKTALSTQIFKTNLSDTSTSPIPVSKRQIEENLSILQLLIPVASEGVLPSEYSSPNWTSTTPLLIELGQDFADEIKLHPESYYYGY